MRELQTRMSIGQEPLEYLIPGVEFAYLRPIVLRIDALDILSQDSCRQPQLGSEAWHAVELAAEAAGPAEQVVVAWKAIVDRVEGILRVDACVGQPVASLDWHVDADTAVTAGRFDLAETGALEERGDPNSEFRTTLPTV